MKSSLVYYFIKEEVRLHMSLTRSANYYAYPFMLMFFFVFITVFANYFFDGFDSVGIGNFAINILFVGGIMSGTFGLYARDFLERKFGDTGRLFQNALIQPIKLSKVFMLTAISDTFFYLFWFILPLMVGYGLGLVIVGRSFGDIFFLAISGFGSFLLGLLVAFFFSVVYERSRVLFGLFCVMFGLGIGYLMFSYGLYNISPFHMFYYEQSWIFLLYSILLVLVVGLFAYFSVGREFQTSIRKSERTKSFNFNLPFNVYLIKDFIDMRRTGDLFGKPFFNVFLPSVLVLVMFMNSREFGLFNLGTLFFAIIIGTLGTQMLNSLINSDSMAYYKHLPVGLKDFMKPKIELSLFICFVESVVILLAYAYYIGSFENIVEAWIVSFALLVYNFNLSFFLTGLNPNENLMHAKTFMTFFVLLVPVLILIIVINILFSTSILYFLLFLIFCVLCGKLYFNLGLRRWDVRD